MTDFFSLIVSRVSALQSSEKGAVCVLIMACVGLLWGMRSPQARSSGSPSLWLCLLFGSLCSLTDGPIRWTYLGLSVGCALAHWVSRKGERSDLPTSQATLSIFLGAGLAATTYLLCHRLVPNLKIPLVWEGAVILSFLPEVRDLKVFDAFFSRLLWTEGLLSEGDYSLLYGFPTALLLSTHSSLLSLRIFSVIFFLATALLLGVFCRRYAHPLLGVTACVVFGLNQLGLIFGRYGSSVAATLFSLVTALGCCASSVSHPTLPRVFAAGGALYVATLGYAPARLIVLALIGLTLLGLCYNTRVSRARHIALSALLCGGVVFVFLIQHHFDRTGVYASARNEQFFKLFGSGLWPDPIIPKWRTFKLEGRPPQLSDYIDFGRELLVTTTLPQLKDLTLPFGRAPGAWREFTADPLYLELYASYLFPFLVLGALMSYSYLSRWTTATLWVWTFVALAPLLFTNRVDSYRASTALIPFSIWIAIGVTETIRELRDTRLPGVVTGFIACAAILGTTALQLPTLSVPNVTPTTTDLLIATLEPRFISNSIVAVEAQEFRSSAQTQLLTLGRQQRGLPIPAEILSAGKYQALISKREADSDLRERVLKDMVTTLERGATVILAPRAQMDPIIQRLGSQGFKAYPSPVLGDTVVLMLK